MKKTVVFIIACLLGSPSAIAQSNLAAQALKSLAPAGPWTDTTQIPVCQQTGGCGLTSTPLQRGTASQIKDYMSTKGIVPAPFVTFTQGDPTGVSDSTAALQAAVTAMCGATPVAGTLFLPAGVFKVHDITAPCSGFHLTGAGQGGTPTSSEPGAFTGLSATVLNCSAMTDHCIQIGQNGSVANRYVGASISNLSTYNSGGTGVVFKIRQTYDAHVDHVWMESPPHALQYYGNQYLDTQWVDIRGNVSDPAIEVYGDLSGKSSSGGTCSLGDCSSRQDITTFEHVNGIAPNSSVGFMYAHDQTFGVNGAFITWEGGAYGLKVRCASGMPNVGYCPQQFRFFDFENEFGLLPLDLQDFTDYKCSHCYFAGLPGGGSGTVVISATLTSYTQVAGGGGGFVLDHSEVFGANHSCIYINVTDVQIDHNQIFGCGLQAGTYASVEFNNGLQAVLTGNQYCNELGFSAGIQAGIKVNSGYSDVNSSNDTFISCTSNVVNNSAVPYTVKIKGALPAPPFGAITSISGCGSGCTIVGSTGNELGGELLMTTGTGSGSSGSFTVSLPQPLYPAPLCSFFPLQGGTGTWAATAAPALVHINNNSSVTVNWTNAGSSLTDTSGYFIGFTCSDF